MFTVIFSNRLETLFDHLAERLRQPRVHVLQPERVVVPSKGIGRWLTLRLAERQGICANVEFQLPATLAWDLLRLRNPQLSQRSTFAAEVLTWRVLDWLVAPWQRAQHPVLDEYLAGGDDRRALDLAQRIAAVLDQYMVFRPEWLLHWSRDEPARKDQALGPDESWQRALWLHLCQGAQAEQHRVALMQDLRQALSKGEVSGLPERLAIFAISSSPPMYLELFKLLGHWMPVDLYALAPCREYWGDIADPNEQARLERRHGASAEQLLLTEGHPLLASLGKQGREFFEELAQEFDPKNFVDTAPTTLLTNLQHDILTLQTPPERRVLAADDRSIALHACHSPMREVEVLRDQLLLRFAADPGLQPGDVVVLAPDIERYAPFISAVFGREQPRLPYAIADRGLASETPLLAAFLELLEVLSSRFPADQVMALLDHPAVAARCRLDGADLDAVRSAVRATRVRWGRDAAHRAASGQPASAEFTWRQAIDRWLLGYALPGAVLGDALFDGLAPYDEMEGERAATLGRFAEWLERLFDFAAATASARTPAAWADWLSELADALFAPNDDERAAFERLHDTLTGLRECVATAAIDRPLSFGAIRRWLADALVQPGGSGGFLSGGITFCAMLPLRSLPFRVVCVLGMNDGEFPREHRSSGFDLMALHPQKGDRSRRDDDRYLLLETLLSAREQLVISFVGASIRDNTPLPPSVLIGELLDTLDAGFVEADGRLPSQARVQRHPLQPFSPRYFSGEQGLPSFADYWYAAAQQLQQVPSPPAVFARSLAEPDEPWRSLALADLLSFYRHPLRYLLQRRLGLHLPEADGLFEHRDPFAIDWSVQDHLRDRLIAVERGQLDPIQAQLRFRAAGQLAPGRYGDFGVDRQARLVKTLWRREQVRLCLPPQEPLTVTWRSGRFEVTHVFRRLTSAGNLHLQLDKTKPRHWLEAWLEHLLLCAVDATPRDTWLITLDRSWRIPHQADAAEILGGLLESQYWPGLRRPLPLPLKAGFAYAAAGRNHHGVKINDSRRAADKVWYGDDWSPSEANDPYYRTLYTYGDSPLNNKYFADFAATLWNPLLDMARPEST